MDDCRSRPTMILSEAKGVFAFQENGVASKLRVSVEAERLELSAPAVVRLQAVRGVVGVQVQNSMIRPRCTSHSWRVGGGSRKEGGQWNLRSSGSILA
jgi:hypothetical protein